MSNKLKGKVLDVQTQSGTNTKGSWTRLTVVVETSSQFNNTVPVQFFNPAFQTPSKGQEVEIDYFVGGREYQGKYYAQIDGSQLIVVGGSQSIPEPNFEPAGVADDIEDDQLPF